MITSNVSEQPQLIVDEKASVAGKGTGVAAGEIPGDVRGRHAEKERAAKAGNRSRVA